MNKKLSDREIWIDLINNWMPIIDMKLAESQLPINIRPLHSSIIFVEEIISDIKGDTKENYFEKFWFQDIQNIVTDWYKEIYGDSFERSDDQDFYGVIDIFDTPFLLQIPILIKNENYEDSETFFITLPNCLQPEENIYNFLVKPPKISSMDNVNKTKTKNKISFVVNKLRSIHCDLFTATKKDKIQITLSNSIIIHLVNCATKLSDSAIGENVALAFWEIQMAIEKTLKLYLRQNKITPKNTHDLKELNKVTSKYNLNLGNSYLNKIPNEKEMIKLRYCESEKKFGEGIQSYYDTLEIVSKCTRKLKRKYTFNNARFTIKKPKYRNLKF